MNAITQSLLAGAALGALATAPAVAGNAPAFHVTALHAGNVVNKTKVHNPHRRHLTYTFGVSTYVPASDLRIKTKLEKTFYRWSLGTGSSQSCAFSSLLPTDRIKAPKRSTYGKIGTTTESYSLGCVYGRTVYYGDTYKLVNSAGEGRTDTFVSVLYGKWSYNSTKYKGTLYLDVSVAIGKPSASGLF